MRLARICGLVLLPCLGALTGCGDDEAASRDQPPRVTRTLAGLGPVADADAAAQRVVTQYLGLAAGRQADGPNGATVIGQGTDAPLSDVYQVPGGALPAGTEVRTAEPQTDSDAWPLPEPHFVFWVDPMPGADLGHRCFTLYVRASDGRILEQQNEFDPLTDGERPLEFDSARSANRIYRHELWQLSEDDFASDAASSRSASRDLAAGTTVRTVIIAGTSEARRQDDISAATNFAKNKLGQSDADITVVQDTETDRLTPAEVEAAISAAAAGLGEDDKLLVVVSSHGSKLSFTVGEDFMLWYSLATILSDRVDAEHINVLLGPCHSGAAVEEFDEVAGSFDSRIQLLTSTDADHPSWAPSGGSVPLNLYYEKVGAALETANGDGTLTIDEIEGAFGGVDLTADECNQRYLAIYKQRQSTAGAVIEAIASVFGADWESNFLEDGGEEDDVRPHGDPKNHVIDGRPTTGPAEPVREQEPNDSCGTATQTGTTAAGAGEVSAAGDLDHYRVDLPAGDYEFKVNSGFGLYLDPGFGQPLSGSTKLDFSLTQSASVCAGVYGKLGSYTWSIEEK